MYINMANLYRVGNNDSVRYVDGQKEGKKNTYRKIAQNVTEDDCL